MLRSLLLPRADLLLRRSLSCLSAASSSSSLPCILQPQQQQPAQPLLHGGHTLHTSSSSAASSPHHKQHDAADVDSLRQQLLDAALHHVKRHGWSHASLAAAARDLQLSSAVVGLFPRGPSQLVEHFVSQQNAALQQELQDAQQQYLALPLRQRITAAVRRRLELNLPHIDSLPQALALLAQPSNAPAALALLTQLLDTIWYAAGDTATDASWYTKRAGLATVYLSTELYMLTDYSAGYADTWAQLERRIDDVLWLGAAAQSLGALPQLLVQALAARTGGPNPHAPAAAASAAGAAGQQQPSEAHAAAAVPPPAATSSSGSSGPVL